jgi:O-antigen/teichoic acid export membrane protein
MFLLTGVGEQILMSINKIPIYIAQLLSNKLSVDIIWNFAALLIFALCGLAINIIIGRVYGPEHLGVFNLVMALYVIASQISVGGVHFSTLRYSSEYSMQKEILAAILSSGLILASAISLTICFVIWLMKDMISLFFASEKVGLGVVYALPGLFFFSLNKIFSALANGMRHMRMFAFTNALRGILIISFIIYICSRKIDPLFLSLCFSFSEPVLFAIFVVYLFIWNRIPMAFVKLAWLKKHGDFSLRGIFIGLLMDLNLRIDVLLLGHFTTARMVGIYSMASMIAEGIYQIPIVFQTNVNPILTDLILKRQMSRLKKMVSQMNFAAVSLMLFVSATLYLSYPLIAVWLTGNSAFIEGQMVFAILALGITLSSGYSCFGNILSQGGYPGLNTIYFLTIVATNVVLNLLLIPLAGMIGSATATCLTYILSIVYLKRFVSWAYRIRI